jgi:predicted CoA-binding protein
MNSKTVVDDFVNQKSYAVVGVSRNGRKFGNTIFKELKKKGIKVFSVNPNMNEFEGEKCYPTLVDIPYTVDAVIINVPPTQAEKVVADAYSAGIKKVWLQQGSQSESAVEYCKEHNMDCVSNECILMFLEPAAFIHRAHKWLWGVVGKLPQ